MLGYSFRVFCEPKLGFELKKLLEMDIWIDLEVSETH